MIERIMPQFYRIEIPLPNSPLKALNAYLIKGKKRCLLVDTGMNRKECLGAMRQSLDELGVDLNRTDLFITHIHADHLGLVEKLATKNSKVYFGETETALVTLISKQREQRFQELYAYFISNGFPEEELKKALKNHPGFRYSPNRLPEFSVLREGDRLDIGNYSFQCLETPGHSPGHMCLYEAGEKILLSGDHILSEITPNITRWPELENSLGRYLESLEKIYRLEVDLVLPGHRSLMHDHRKRITELLSHHRERLDEAFAAVVKGHHTAWEIAPHITWDLHVDSWASFPSVQKWFAIGETMAHLDHLKAEGRIKRKNQNNMVFYSLE